MDDVDLALRQSVRRAAAGAVHGSGETAHVARREDRRDGAPLRAPQGSRRGEQAFAQGPQEIEREARPPERGRFAREDAADRFGVGQRPVERPDPVAVDAPLEGATVVGGERITQKSAHVGDAAERPVVDVNAGGRFLHVFPLAGPDA